jgi:hypothetical protein
LASFHFPPFVADNTTVLNFPERHAQRPQIGACYIHQPKIPLRQIIREDSHSGSESHACDDKNVRPKTRLTLHPAEVKVGVLIFLDGNFNFIFLPLLNWSHDSSREKEAPARARGVIVSVDL